jgi:hypothetical protein
MGVWRCKVSLRCGIRNNVGLYRCGQRRVDDKARKSLIVFGQLKRNEAMVIFAGKTCVCHARWIRRP